MTFLPLVCPEANARVSSLQPGPTMRKRALNGLLGGALAVISRAAFPRRCVPPSCRECCKLMVDLVFRHAEPRPGQPEAWPCVPPLCVNSHIFDRYAIPRFA